MFILFFLFFAFYVFGVFGFIFRVIPNRDRTGGVFGVLAVNHAGLEDMRTGRTLK